MLLEGAKDKVYESFYKSNADIICKNEVVCPSKLEIRHYFTFGIILIDAQILPLFHGCLLSKNEKYDN